MALVDQATLKKKTAVSRSWILFDCKGQSTVLDVDKYVIMRRFQIHARDLRILDPMLSYPSTILGRDKVIVLNLEVIVISVQTVRFCTLFELFQSSDFVLFLSFFVAY